jgi:SGNH domain (fused to AT3 domains)
VRGAGFVAAALAATLAAPEAAHAIDFDPYPHHDPPDAAAGALDVRRVKFGQRDLRMVLDVRTRGAWRPRGERTLCLVLERRAPSSARGPSPQERLCVVHGRRGGAFLRWTPAVGKPRVVPATVSRRDGRSLRATFAPRTLGLPLGRLRWAVESRGDRSPDRGWRTASVRLVGQPYCFGAAARDPRRPCRNPALRRAAFPRPVDAFTWDSAPCRPLPHERRGPFAPCAFGVDKRTFDFAIVGDSHGMHWRRALEVVAEARRWRGISIARPGCPFTTAIPRSHALGPGQCARMQRRTIAWLAAHPEVETLFVSNWAFPGYGGSAADHGAMLDRVPASVKRIYVLRDVPRMTVRAFDCVRARRGRSLVNACANRRSAVLSPDRAAAAASARARAHVIDLTRVFCGPARCYPVIGGAYVYKDFDHMNAVFALSLGPFVLRAL